ncbi:MAG TPA: hypothetical protein VH208_01540 [Myxococcaceae bacterium]|nr:hypothetical protein [Myxococcaceae bacterium]
MPPARKIVVEVTLPAPVEQVWERSQVPDLHVQWDIRFDTIRYLDEVDARGFRKLDYRTGIGFGLEIRGFGAYLHSAPLEHSSFEFDSTDWKSLITRGRGVWIYRRVEGGTFFKTVYDYDVRFGALGRAIDALLFRPMIRLATEWSFETLRRGLSGDEACVAPRRSRWRFLPFFVARLFGRPARPQQARSWLGSGQTDDQPAAASVSAEGRAR